MVFTVNEERGTKKRDEVDRGTKEPTDNKYVRHNPAHDRYREEMPLIWRVPNTLVNFGRKATNMLSSKPINLAAALVASALAALCLFSTFQHVSQSMLNIKQPQVPTVSHFDEEESRYGTCFTKGRYIAGADFQYVPYIPVDPWQRSCDEPIGQNTVARPYQHFTWEADERACDTVISEMYKADLCKQSRRAGDDTKMTTILFVGDSLTFQTFSSAVLQYGHPPDAGEEHQFVSSRQENRRRNAESLLCDKRILL